MYQLIRCSILVYSLLILGCANQYGFFIPLENPPLADAAYPGFERIELISAEDILSLNQGIRDQVEQRVNIYPLPEERLHRLLTEILGSSRSQLAYDITANTIASETFYNREANCLSLSIMGYALARGAGLDVQFQRVDTPDYWESINGYRFNTNHVNLRFNLPRSSRASSELAKIPEQFRFRTGVVELDFAPTRVDARFERNPLTEKDIISMFYSNISVEALINDDHARAYAYMRAADELSPGRADNWVNMGVLYNRGGHVDLALEAYRYALSRDRDNLSAASNYISLMETVGRGDEVVNMKIAVERRRNSNPYYHAFLAQEAFNQSDFSAAKSQYMRAIRLESGAHEFCYGLANSNYHLGELQSTLRNLERARELAYFEQDIRRYSIAIDKLRQEIAK